MFFHESMAREHRLYVAQQWLIVQLYTLNTDTFFTLRLYVIKRFQCTRIGIHTLVSKNTESMRA